jgi:hypothetical protein
LFLFCSGVLFNSPFVFICHEGHGGTRGVRLNGNQGGLAYVSGHKVGCRLSVKTPTLRCLGALERRASVVHCSKFGS